ncbi:MAG: hypothetical protein L6R42_001341 [Xanthoria sp. 1 TBL-2021]|nr:MAG: hypothetical protein L6R42_001341 [Xanthoria sp. 1 TBL-2021]
MDSMASPTPSSTAPYKRKRSPSVEGPTPPLRAVKPPNYNQLQINYLARQNQGTLPLISIDDPLPALQSVIADYDAVLQRHESMASNLGARPLGPILFKRFERLFDGPPKVLKSHSKEGNSVGWLDVVEFARSKPEQFNLEKTRDGVRVCLFYTKQCRVEITEEDYQLIASGMPQKLIPPQPILEDEEKELGTLEILERKISQVVQMADLVSGRARQVNHRLRNRKNAIISRREAEAAASDDYPARSPTSSGHRVAQSNGERMSVSPTSGFVAVNQQASNQDVRNEATYTDTISLPDPLPSGRPPNGTLLHSASAATRAELLSKFFTNSQRAATLDQEQGKVSSLTARPASSGKVKLKHASDDPAVSGSPVPIPHTPSSLLPYSKSTPQDRFDDSGPYKSDMMARMEQLNRGDRVQPPCDRCRRLHMDCSKNLTACIGCTRKHAKCSWKDVTEQELRDNPPILRSTREGAMDSGSGGEVEQRSRDPYSDLPTISHNNVPRRDFPKEEARGVRDEELLGEEASGDEGASHHGQHLATIPNPPTASMSTEQKETIRSMNERTTDDVSRALPSPNKEHDDQASTIFTAGSEYEGKPPTSTDGFQSVNVKGVVVGYDPSTEQDDIEMKTETEQDRERDALIQLSAAAQQVSEYQQQQREFPKEEAEEQHAQAQ